MPVRIADDVFGELDIDGYYVDTGFAVSSDAPDTMVVAAVAEVARRWRSITDSGDDLSHINLYEDDMEDELEALRVRQGREAWDVPYTPNSVDWALGPRGPEVVADCKGAMSVPMAETLKRVIREELARVGVENADVVRLPDS